METKTYTFEIHNLNDSRDVYRIHRALLKEVYMADFQSELNKKLIVLKIQEQDCEKALDIIEAQGFFPRMIQRFTTGIEGIF